MSHNYRFFGVLVITIITTLEQLKKLFMFEYYLSLVRELEVKLSQTELSFWSDWRMWKLASSIFKKTLHLVISLGTCYILSAKNQESQHAASCRDRLGNRETLLKKSFLVRQSALCFQRQRKADVIVLRDKAGLSVENSAANFLFNMKEKKSRQSGVYQEGFELYI